MFDPFKDFATSGYLRNAQKLKDPEEIKIAEHSLFRANLHDALKYISSRNPIEYGDFLKVHSILFSEFYPWAGKDRALTAPDIAIKKGEVLFSPPQYAQPAVDAGLKIGQSKDKMNQSLGEVMGFFAYGHPFLDGNGRTMMIVYAELCYRAGFSINWINTNKRDYLKALTEEIKDPRRKVLDKYLLGFKEGRIERKALGQSILSVKGLDGLDDDTTIDGEFSNKDVAEKYKEFHKQRGYEVADSQDLKSSVCDKCNTVPCICDEGEGNQKIEHPGI